MEIRSIETGKNRGSHIVVTPNSMRAASAGLASVLGLPKSWFLTVSRGF